MIKCLECGSGNVHIIAYNTESVLPMTIDPVNPGTERIQNNDLPYILGGNYCCNCQRLVSVYDDDGITKNEIEKEPEKMASVKQKKYIAGLIEKWKTNEEYRSEYQDIDYGELTASLATSIIHDLRHKLGTEETKPVQNVVPATEKQINLIKNKMADSEEIAEKYANINFEKLNIVTAKKIISEILEKKQED